MFDGHRVLSEPVRVMWAGFETDTLRLQRAGWSLSAEQDVCRGAMRLAMRHEQAQAFAISDPMDWHYREAGWHRTVCVHMRMAHRIEFREMGRVDWNFQPIDAQPTFIPDFRFRQLEDFAHFAPSLVRTKEIIIPEETVPDLLERILALQEPGRQEALKRQLQADRAGMTRDAIPRQKFHAQILSIAA